MTLTDESFELAYQELLAEHIAGDCPDDCAWCEEEAAEREPLKLDIPGRNAAQPAADGYRFTFGQHKGKLLNEVPDRYLDRLPPDEVAIPAVCLTREAPDRLASTCQAGGRVNDQGAAHVASL